MNPAKQNVPEGAPNCWQCRHFAVSWDPSLPYQCRLMGFKSRVTPSLEVLRADGQRCRGFMQKPATATARAPGAPSAIPASQRL